MLQSYFEDVRMNQKSTEPTTLVIQQVVLLQQLPVHQQALGCASWVKDSRVFTQKLLEHVQLGLTRLLEHKEDTQSIFPLTAVTRNHKKTVLDKRRV